MLHVYMCIICLYVICYTFTCVFKFDMFRCFAALKDVSKLKSLQKINEMASGDGYQHYKVRAKLAILDKQFKQAESIYLEQVCTTSIATHTSYLFRCIRGNYSTHIVFPFSYKTTARLSLCKFLYLITNYSLTTPQLCTGMCVGGGWFSSRNDIWVGELRSWHDLMLCVLIVMKPRKYNRNH